MARSAAADDLDRVIETESRVQALLAEAAAEVRRRVAAAREVAREAEERLARDLDAAAARRREESARGCDRALAAIDAEARSEIARLEAIEGERLEELVAWVLARLEREGRPR